MKSGTKSGTKSVLDDDERAGLAGWLGWLGCPDTILLFIKDKFSRVLSALSNLSSSQGTPGREREGERRRREEERRSEERREGGARVAYGPQRTNFRSFSSTSIDRGIDMDRIGVEKSMLRSKRESRGESAKNCSVPENRDASILECRKS